MLTAELARRPRGRRAHHVLDLACSIIGAAPPVIDIDAVLYGDAADHHAGSRDGRAWCARRGVSAGGQLSRHQTLIAKAMRTAAADTVGIVTREEHTVLGGLGSAVLEGFAIRERTGLATPHVEERVASFAAGAA